MERSWRRVRLHFAGGLGVAGSGAVTHEVRLCDRAALRSRARRDGTGGPPPTGPQPDYLGCDVGTSLYRWEGGSWSRDETYRAEMRRRVGAAAPGEILSRVCDLAGLRPQEGERQAEFKASFYWDVSEGAGSVRGRVERTLEGLSVTATLIVSTDPEGRMGLLDILPEGASKASALEYIRRSLGLSMDRVAFSGDSGNDVEALLSGVLGVVVGNASEDVGREVRRRAASRGLERRIIFAAGSYADGVIEGLRGHGFL